MSAERLREAAASMRSRAAASTASPWIRRRGPGEHVYGELGGSWVADVATREDMRHIASWHPTVALAVADWLDYAARCFDAAVTWNSERDADDMVAWAREPAELPDLAHALAVANAYLGDPS